MERKIKTDWSHLNMDYEPTHYSQWDILKDLCTSMSYKEIAAKKGVLESTISGSAQRLYKNTNARDRFELCVWAVKKGYVNI